MTAVARIIGAAAMLCVSGTALCAREPGLAAASASAAPTPEAACLSAIGAAELRYKTPPGLLLAIARTESGRRSARTGTVQPWPWTVNANGAGVFFANQPEAVAYVAQASQQPGASIDTGCMQVNLQQHPHAFPRLADAFNPQTNADYAARFLVSLHAQTRDWSTTIGYYHSHTPVLAQLYRQAVSMRLGGPGLLAPPLDPKREMLDAMKQAWSATLPQAEPVGGMWGLPVHTAAPLPPGSRPRERPLRRIADTKVFHSGS